MPEHDPLSQYLTKLRSALAQRLPADDERIERIVIEAREHLRDAAQPRIASGATPDDAMRGAIDDFGAPDAVAQRFQAELYPRPSLGALLLRTYVYSASLVGVILFAAGVQILGIGAAAIFSYPFFGVSPQDIQLPPECARESYATYCSQLVPVLVGFPLAVSLWIIQVLMLSGLAALVAGGIIWGVHEIARRRLVGNETDRSFPAQAYRVLGIGFFGLATLIVFPSVIESAVGNPGIATMLLLLASSVRGFFLVRYVLAFRQRLPAPAAA